MKKLIGSICIVLLLGSCGIDDKDTGEEQIQEMDGRQLEVIVDHLQAPWAINKHEDVFYITERAGEIVRVQNGELSRQDVLFEQQLSDAAEAGLLGFVLAPNFADTNQAFAYYTYNKDGKLLNRVVLLQLVEEVWHERLLLIDEIPSGTYHHGGRLKIGPDHKLYITTGDASNPELAQNKDSLAGKILRVNLDGSIPEDNPFKNSMIYSYGHRNPQGLAWTPEGVMYATEHGQSANDEVNEIKPGENYGWPDIEGAEKQDGLLTPLFTSGKDHTWAPSGVAYDQDMLYVAALRGTALLAFDLKTSKVREVVNDVGRIRDVWIEEDTLYFITNNTDGRGQQSTTDDHLYKLILVE
ncbi:MAG: PQQ-dependent sugar dehydrogenase [Solibacillus sp.]|uniref:PQQ-dependent sugar dehydrogenase n=1 Tax=unclassified Solibacillus TaxID=2637870 RepID=UPI0031012797